jgi:hypothetical protein
MITDVVPELELAVQAGLYRPGNLELDAYMLWGALIGAGDFLCFAPSTKGTQIASIPAIASAYLALMSGGTQPTPPSVTPR